MYLTTQTAGDWLIDSAVRRAIDRHTAEWESELAVWNERVLPPEPRYQRSYLDSPAHWREQVALNQRAQLALAEERAKGGLRNRIDAAGLEVLIDFARGK